MFLKEVSEMLDYLYAGKDLRDHTIIFPKVRFDGDSMFFRFRLEEEKYCLLETSDNFGEWLACCTPDGWKEAVPVIRRLADPYGVEFDAVKGRLFIRFRRNELPLAQAVLRLEQAMLVTGSLGKIIKCE